MLNKNDINYLLNNFSDNGSDEAARVLGKLQVLSEQIQLQEEFRNRQLQIQEKMKELDSKDDKE